MGFYCNPYITKQNSVSIDSMDIDKIVNSIARKKDDILKLEVRSYERGLCIIDALIDNIPSHAVNCYNYSWGSSYSSCSYSFVCMSAYGMISLRIHNSCGEQICYNRFSNDT